MDARNINRRQAMPAILSLPLGISQLLEQPKRKAPLTEVEQECYINQQWWRPFSISRKLVLGRIPNFQITGDVRLESELDPKLVSSPIHHFFLFGNAGYFSDRRKELVDALGEALRLSEVEVTACRPLYDELLGQLFGRLAIMAREWPAILIAMPGYITSRKRFGCRNLGVEDQILSCDQFRPNCVDNLPLEFGVFTDRFTIHLPRKTFSDHGRTPLHPPPDRSGKDLRIVTRKQARSVRFRRRSFTGLDAVPDLVYQAALAGVDDLPLLRRGRYYPKPVDASPNRVPGFSNITVVVMGLLTPVGRSCKVRQISVCWDRPGVRLLDFNSSSRSFGRFVTHYPVHSLMASVMGLKMPDGVSRGR